MAFSQRMYLVSWWNPKHVSFLSNVIMLEHKERFHLKILPTENVLQWGVLRRATGLNKSINFMGRCSGRAQERNGQNVKYNLHFFHNSTLDHNSFFKKKNIYLFLERREGREKERERNISVSLPLVYPLLGTWPATQLCLLTRNRTSDLLVLRLAFNPLSRTS